jgi:hypothetical protein
MSIQRSIQTGLLIGNNLQTAALRSQVAQMQQLAVAQQSQQNEIEGARQIIFEAHKLLDTAERNLQTDPLGAVYTVRMAQFSARYLDEGALPNLGDKQALYQNQRRGADLLARGESLLAPEAAQAMHRLVWLHQIRATLFQFHTWLQIAERLRGSAFLFVPPPGFVRGLILFIAGQLFGALFAGYVLLLSQILALIVFVCFNGITLIFADIFFRQRLLGKCNVLAQTAGGWVGPQMRTPVARRLAEQLRAQLSSWDYRSTSKTSEEAGKELAKLDQEIAHIRQVYFSGN